jgi:hypothetical protein
MRSAFVAALVAAAAVACSPGAQSYGDVDELVAALREQAVGCSRVRPTAAELVDDGATCESGGGRLSLFVFETEADRDRWAGVAGQVADFAFGPNWAVVGPPAAIGRIVEGLGAER